LEKENREKAKKIKEEGNAHYIKQELDMAISKYDKVILKQKWTTNVHRNITQK